MNFIIRRRIRIVNMFKYLFFRKIYSMKVRPLDEMTEKQLFVIGKAEFSGIQFP